MHGYTGYFELYVMPFHRIHYFDSIEKTDMARFWFLNDKAEQQLMPLLGAIPQSHLLSREEEENYSINFENHMYGDRFLLMDPRWQIEPCDMGV